MDEEVKTDSQEEVVETIDSTNDEEVVESQEDDTDTPTVEDYLALKQKNKELYERAKKAEALAKAKRTALPNKPNETQSLSREEAILYAKGYTDEEVALANKIAKIEGVSPLVAVEDEIFKGKVEARKRKEKSEQASLPPSGGKGRITPEKPVGEMSREEHEQYFKKVMGL